MIRIEKTIAEPVVTYGDLTPYCINNILYKIDKARCLSRLSLDLNQLIKRKYRILLE